MKKSIALLVACLLGITLLGSGCFSVDIIPDGIWENKDSGLTLYYAPRNGVNCGVLSVKGVEKDIYILCDYGQNFFLDDIAAYGVGYAPNQEYMEGSYRVKRGKVYLYLSKDSRDVFGCNTIVLEKTGEIEHPFFDVIPDGVWLSEEPYFKLNYSPQNGINEGVLIYGGVERDVCLTFLATGGLEIVDQNFDPIRMDIDHDLYQFMECLSYQVIDGEIHLYLSEHYQEIYNCDTIVLKKVSEINETQRNID